MDPVRVVRTDVGGRGVDGVDVEVADGFVDVDAVVRPGDQDAEDGSGGVDLEEVVRGADATVAGG